ncbi:MAG: CotH kinase family protein, partial [Deltaproteobacteria bacterium]|nr:CotH kinase family protein [Deltaproteobacteria bacterium]MBN2674245.1 CotH kinase family protein [Deltaproteobacteria bacterium]
SDADTDTDTDADTDITESSQWVFDEGTIRIYRLTMAADDWTHLQEEGVDEEYVSADLEVDGQTWNNIGVRLKGSYSLDSCWSMGTRLWDGHCQKISMKLDFTEFDDTLRFKEMKKINLHSMSADLTKMHERLGYHLFRAIGLVAPRSVPAQVYVNDTYLGIFQAVENVDGRFTANRFPGAGDGNLFKEIWPSSEIDSADDVWDALKTNDEPEDNPDISDFIEFNEALTAVTADNIDQNLFPYVNVDEMLKFLVVDRAIHNWDGPLSFYWGANHNYYWYHRESGQWLLIPWDLDKTFWEYDRYFAPNPDEGITTPVPGWNVIPNECPSGMFGGMYTIAETIGPPEEGPASNTFVAPGCDPLISILASMYWDDFVSHGTTFMETQFTLENLNSILDIWQAQIDSVMQIEPTLSYSEWLVEMETLRSHLPKLRSDLATHLADSYRHE